MKSFISDIHSYIVFANIDNRKGKIKGHRVILTDEQMEQIEIIIASSDVKVDDEVSYEADIK